MIGVSVTMMKRDRVARSGRHDPRARVAELADALALGSCPARGEGSNPSSRTPPSEARLLTTAKVQIAYRPQAQGANGDVSRASKPLGDFLQYCSARDL